VLSQKFGEKFLTTLNKTDDNPVHLLFNQWWNEAPDDVKQKYLDIFLGDPVYQAWYEAGHYADPVDFDALGTLPEGTLGNTYYHWIVDNDLTAQMTFGDPNTVVPLMDAIADGWTFGKTAPHLMAQPWEEMFDQPLAEVRDRYGLTPSPMAARQSAAMAAAAAS
jgi:ubiquinone biosynthesis protein Coq4